MMNSQFHMDAKLPLVMWHLSANYIATTHATWNFISLLLFCAFSFLLWDICKIFLPRILKYFLLVIP